MFDKKTIPRISPLRTDFGVIGRYRSSPMNQMTPVVNFNESPLVTELETDVFLFFSSPPSGEPRLC